MEKVSLDDITKAGATRKRTANRLERDINHLTELVIAGLRQGLPPTKVATASGWTQAHVRAIARAHGIEPAKRTPKPDPT